MLSAAQQVEGGMEGQGQARDHRKQRHKRRDCTQLCVLALGPCSTVSCTPRLGQVAGHKGGM